MIASRITPTLHKPHCVYLEERVEQAEKQQETTARAVADLTTDVKAIRHDLEAGVKQVNVRLDTLETDVAVLKQDMAIVKETLQMMMVYLREKLT